MYENDLLIVKHNDVYYIGDDEEHDISHVSMKESNDGLISYYTGFYNGGAHLTEMLQYGLDNM